MSRSELSGLRPHEDPDLFREALNFTSAETAFTARLIEKDYFCTILLQHLAEGSEALVFKGGTCLAKVHAEFYRLSEDLDFVIPMPTNATRAARSTRAAGLKEAVALLGRQLPGFRLMRPLSGANSSTQYVAVASYTSLLSRQEETIKIEVGLREPLLTDVVSGLARTILLDPVTGQPWLTPAAVRCISKIEAFAEKFRAALSRREVAIRDFYDIDFAIRRLQVRPEDAELIGLVRQKLAVPGNDPVDVSVNRLDALRQQLGPQLKPVLRAGDFAEFDLERAFRTVAQMAAKVA